MKYKYSLTIPRSLAQESARCILTTILFHRLLGPSHPVRHDAFHGQFMYSGVESEGVDLVEEKSTQVAESSASRVVVEVRFSNTRTDAAAATTRTKGWFRQQDPGPDTYWETWEIVFDLVEDRDKSMTRVAKEVRTVMLDIIMQSVSADVPPITTADTAPFPYDIVVKPNGQGDVYWGSVIKRILD